MHVYGQTSLVRFMFQMAGNSDGMSDMLCFHASGLVLLVSHAGHLHRAASQARAYVSLCVGLDVGLCVSLCGSLCVGQRQYPMLQPKRILRQTAEQTGRHNNSHAHPLFW